MSLTLAALSFLLLSQAPAVSVSFDLRPLPEQDYRRLDGLEMERKVSLRLVQEGLAVVAPDAPAPHLRIEARRTPDGLVLVAKGRGAEIEERVEADPASLPALHLEVAQKASALARRLGQLPEPRAEAPAPVASAPASPPSSGGVELSASAGVSWRGAAVDPLGLISVDGALGPVGLGAEVGVAPSSAGALHVYEVQGAAFVGHRVPVGTKLSLEPGVGGGLIVHRYRLADRWAASTEGTEVSPAAWARLEAEIRPVPGFAVGLRVALAALRPLIHQSEGVTMWDRGGFRVETGARISWSP